MVIMLRGLGYPWVPLLFGVVAAGLLYGSGRINSIPGLMATSWTVGFVGWLLFCVMVRGRKPDG